MVGWDVARSDWRTFRVDRLQTPNALGSLLASIRR
ncbi:hypothetical protein [Herbidospora daliensis]